MRILRQREVLARTGVSPMTLWRWRRAGTFPEPIQLGPNSIGYLADEFEAWLAKRAAQRDAKKAATPSTDAPTE